MTDSPALWSVQRHEIEQGSSHDTLLLAGASRIQAGLSHAALQTELPELRIVDLAVTGSCPEATLRDVARHTSFRGILLLAIHEECVGADREDQSDHVAFYHRQGRHLDVRLNARIGSWLQERLAFLSGEVGALRVAREALSGRLPADTQLWMNAARDRNIDYSRGDAARLRKERYARQIREAPAPALEPEEWLRAAAEIDDCLRIIEERGGRTVLLHLPISGNRRRLTERSYPRDLYWDVFATRTAATVIHSEDLDLSWLSLPDESHIDASDSPRFTRLIVDELERRGIV